MKRFLRLRSLHIATFLSFLLSAAFFALFSVFAPGRYDLENGSALVDVLFALLVLGDTVLILLSLVSAVTSLCRAMRGGGGGRGQVCNVLLGVYPAALLLLVWWGDLSAFAATLESVLYCALH